MAFHCAGYSPWCSKTIRTARSRTSHGYGGRPALFCSGIAPSSQGKERSPIPGRFSRAISRLELPDQARDLGPCLGGPVDPYACWWSTARRSNGPRSTGRSSVAGTRPAPSGESVIIGLCAKPPARWPGCWNRSSSPETPTTRPQRCRQSTGPLSNWNPLRSIQGRRWRLVSELRIVLQNRRCRFAIRNPGKERDVRHRGRYRQRVRPDPGVS
jgi:hypothetical protein